MDEFLNINYRGFHDGDYEECRLVGYKNRVHSLYEKHYFSATEPSRLMLWFEVLTAVTMKNAVFWDIKTEFIPYMKNITSLLQGPVG
jgi:hypothetical protein